MSSVDIGTLADFDQGVPRQLKIDGRILVAVRIDDEVFVLDDRCSHEEFYLSDGEVDVETKEIECERHGSMFRLSDGAAVTLPATKPVAHYDVLERDSRLEVVLP
jgi:3-phenylpropionate/trans-cinnamate dioxygenase ferredoxin component